MFDSVSLIIGGEDIRSGLIPRDVLRNQGVRGSCHAVYHGQGTLSVLSAVLV